VAQRTVMAKPPTAGQMIELVKQRLNWFCGSKNLRSNDYPDLYPFEENQIKRIAIEKAGVRSLLEECAKKFDSPVDDKENRRKEFLGIYDKLIQQIDIPIDDDDKFAAIIVCNMKMIPGGGTANVVITQVDYFNSSSHDINLTISGYDSLQNKQVKIRVRICETSKPQTFNAVMKKLLKYENDNITRSCLVRSADIPKSWKASQKLKEQLETQHGGKTVKLKEDEITSLIAIKAIYDEAENYSFTKDEVTEFVKELRLAADNPLICAILSAPI